MNHYQTLQVNPKASQKEIKQAYRRLAKQFHPDSQTETKGCSQIIALNAAYEVLKNSHSRRLYDREQEGHTNDFYTSRQARNSAAQRHYKQQRAAASSEISYLKWLQEVYLPIDSWIAEILYPIETEIDLLAADPFDDYLMENFQDYLDTCNDYWQNAQQKLASQPNPAQLAGVAVNLYYCLNHIGDGIKELEWFTLNYNDHYLHTGQEIFRIAEKLYCQAQEKIEFVL